MLNGRYMLLSRSSLVPRFLGLPILCASRLPFFTRLPRLNFPPPLGGSPGASSRLQSPPVASSCLQSPLAFACRWPSPRARLAVPGLGLRDDAGGDARRSLPRRLGEAAPRGCQAATPGRRPSPVARLDDDDDNDSISAAKLIGAFVGRPWGVRGGEGGDEELNN